MDRTIRLLAQGDGRGRGGHPRDASSGTASSRVTGRFPIVEDASLAQVAAVTAHRLDTELPDVLVERVPTRRYPTDALAAHLFGYVGEVTEEQLVDGGYHAGDIVGQSGLEKNYNKLLVGTDGARRVVVNSMGREIRTLEEVPPTGGPPRAS